MNEKGRTGKLYFRGFGCPGASLEEQVWHRGGGGVSSKIRFPEDLEIAYANMAGFKGRGLSLEINTATLPTGS